jgi:hypothetical protein
MTAPIVVRMVIGVAIWDGLLCGCVNTSEVTPIGRETYMVSTDARGGFTSTADLIARSARKADVSVSAGART